MISSQVAQPQDVYTDLNSLQSINAIGREDKGEALRKVAEQFESMFVKMMMKSMRDANKVFQEDSIMHSPQEDFYQQMYDDQLSVSLTGKQGMGLADVIYRQLNQEYGDPTKNREDKTWQPLDDRRKNFSHAIDFNQIEKKNTQLQPKKEILGFEIDTSFVKPKTSAAKAVLHETSNKETSSTAEDNKTADIKADKIQTFDSPEDFIETLYPVVEKIAKDMGVSPQAIISQAALETGWGKFVIHGENSQGEKENSYNFFGIKADSRWQGEKVSVTTHEYRDGQRITEKADFRSYPTIKAGLKDYADFLQSQRYEKAMAAGTDVEQYAKELQQAGYATDPKYAQKITRIANSELMQNTLLENAQTSAVMEVPRG